MAISLKEALQQMPLVAILRGVRPDEVVAVAEALVRGGIRIIEVPLNSPNALSSIELLTAHLGDRAACGAGTVLSAKEVDSVKAAGASFVVSPNTDCGVIEHVLNQGLLPIPGFATATEAFRAISAGAEHLKLFPANVYGVAHLQALQAVVPAHCRFIAVGGIDAPCFGEWFGAGVDGVGLGSSLYGAGSMPDVVYERACRMVNAYHKTQIGN